MSVSAKRYQPMLMRPQDVRYGTESPSGRYNCRECMMFITPEALGWPAQTADWGRCTNVGLDEDRGGQLISGAYGSCGQWRYQAGKTAEAVQENEVKVSKGLVAYMEYQPGFGCRRCQYFVDDKQPCEQVEAKIEAKGCCMVWNHPRATLFLSVASVQGANLNNLSDRR